MSTWFLSSAMTIGAVLGIRWMVKERVSCRMRYGLWMLVLLRLLIPVNFGESSLSLGQLLPTDGSATALPEPAVQIWDAATAWPTETAESLNVWPLLWGAGAASVLGFFAVSRLVLEIRLRRDRVWLEGGCCPIPVYVTAALDAPCQVGLFRPVVYVTDQAASGELQHHVLLHEMTHLRHFDHLWAVLRCVALALHWFNPLAWVAAWLSKEDAELACDEGVLARLGWGGEIAYGNTLIRLSCKKEGGAAMGINRLMGGKAALRRRIENIACRKRTRWSAAALLAVLSVMTAGCTFTDAPETTLPRQSIQAVQTQTTEPPSQTVELAIQDPQPGYDVWKQITADILTAQEEEMLKQIPGFDSGEDWAEGFLQNIKGNLYYWRSEYGAENAGIVSVEEIFDDRAEPGVHIYEIRCYLGNPRWERSDYVILADNCKAWTSDLDSCRISGVFNSYE